MINIYIGDIGSGKTLSLVKYVYENYYLKDKNIYTNVGLKFFGKQSKSQIIKMSSEFFKDFAKSSQEINDACVIIDEAHVFIDSRRSGSTKNIVFSKFITQSRKKNVDLILTSQDKSPFHFIKSGQIELRVRKLIDNIIYSETFMKYKGRWYKNFNDPVPKDALMLIRNTYYDKYLDKLNVKMFKANPYFKLYNTNEIIDIF